MDSARCLAGLPGLTKSLQSQHGYLFVSSTLTFLNSEEGIHSVSSCPGLKHVSPLAILDSHRKAGFSYVSFTAQPSERPKCPEPLLSLSPSRNSISPESLHDPLSAASVCLLWQVTSGWESSVRQRRLQWYPGIPGLLARLPSLSPFPFILGAALEVTRGFPVSQYNFSKIIKTATTVLSRAIFMLLLKLKKFYPNSNALMTLD